MEPENSEILAETNNGRHNMGYLYDYLITKEIPDNLITVAMGLGRRSLGFNRATTNTPDLHGGNLTMSQWANKIGISKTKFRTTLSKLVALNVVKIHKGSQYRNGGGSYPDYYSIVFDTELQTKHKLFFNISGLVVKDKVVEPVANEPKGLPFTYSGSTEQGNVYQPERNLNGTKVKPFTLEFVADCKIRGINPNKRANELAEQ